MSTFAAALAFSPEKTRGDAEADDCQQVNNDDRPIEVAHRVIHGELRQQFDFIDGRTLGRIKNIQAKFSRCDRVK